MMELSAVVARKSFGPNLSYTRTPTATQQAQGCQLFNSHRDIYHTNECPMFQCKSCPFLDRHLGDGFGSVREDWSFLLYLQTIKEDRGTITRKQARRGDNLTT
jgi:hypothetical protein